MGFVPVYSCAGLFFCRVPECSGVHSRGKAGSEIADTSNKLRRSARSTLLPGIISRGQSWQFTASPILCMSHAYRSYGPTFTRIISTDAHAHNLFSRHHLAPSLVDAKNSNMSSKQSSPTSAIDFSGAGFSARGSTPSPSKSKDPDSIKQDKT